MNKPIIMLLMATLLFISACQPSTTKDQNTLTSIYPENEIPINTKSVEALQKIVDGLRFMDLGDIAKARPFFDEAIKLDPKCVSAYIYRSYGSNSQKEWGEQRDIALNMREQANEGEQLLLDILEYNKSDDYLKALESAKKIVAKYPKSARASQILGRHYAILDDLDNARAQYAKAIELNPDFTKAMRELGLIYLERSPKDFDQAEKYMAMMVEKEPESSAAQLFLGNCYRAQNKLEKALASYTKAAELDSTNLSVYMTIGHVNSFLGNYETARQNYRESRRGGDRVRFPLSFEGFSYLYEGDYKKAMAFLLESAKKVETMDIPEGNKHDAISYVTYCSAMIAMHYGDLKQLKESVEKYKPLMVKTRKSLGGASNARTQKANGQYWDAVVATMNGDYKSAIAQADLINATIESPKEDKMMVRQYHRVHTMVNYQQKKYDKAIEHSLQLDPDDVYDNYRKAKAYQMAGETDKAMELFKGIENYNFNAVGYALIRNEVKEILNPTDG